MIDALVPNHGGETQHPEGVEVLIADIGDAAGVARRVADADVVFNVAGQVSHLASMTDPLRDLDLNVRSQLAFLETLRRARPRARVVLTSTRQVYGRPERLPVDETHPPHPVDVNGDRQAGRRAAPPALRPRARAAGDAPCGSPTSTASASACAATTSAFLPVFFRRALEGDASSCTATASSGGTACTSTTSSPRSPSRRRPSGDRRDRSTSGTPSARRCARSPRPSIWLADSRGRAAADPVAGGPGAHRHR